MGQCLILGFIPMNRYSLRVGPQDLDKISSIENLPQYDAFSRHHILMSSKFNAAITSSVFQRDFYNNSLRLNVLYYIWYNKKRFVQSTF